MPTLSRRRSIKLALGSLLSSLAPASVFSQSKYPDHPIRLIVPRAAGGPLDVVARQWAEQVRTQLGTVMIENMGGGGGTIGMLAAARAAPDGYTLALLGAGELVVNPVIRPSAGFDPARDLAPITILANLNCGIAVAAASPARTLPELIAHIRANAGKMTFGSAGAGTMSHLAGELFKHVGGATDVVHVPYKGSAPAFVDLLAGNISMMAFTVSGETIAMHKAGKIRILAVATDQRLGTLPDVPTGAESGLAQFIASNFLGLFAPPATPRPIIDQIAAAAAQAVRDPAFESKMREQGYELVPNSTPAKATEFVAAEIVRWKPVIQLAGLTKP